MSANQTPASPKKPAACIVLTGGGSGGHITPLLSLAHALKKISPTTKLVYIGWKGDKFDSLQDRLKVFDQTHTITAGKFRRYHGESRLVQLIDIKSLGLNTRDFFRVIAGTANARRLLKKIKPDVVFLKGGFVGVPVGLAAKDLSIPIVTHDSDAVAGLANRIAGRWAVIHATGMPADYYNYPPDTIKYVGIPIDERIERVTDSERAAYKRELGIAQDAPLLLVGGAGLGAQGINNKMVQIASQLFEKIDNLHIIHFAGQKHMTEVMKGYQENLSGDQLNKLNVLGFKSDFYKYSGTADLVVSRAGATTLAELAVQAKAVLIIPAPFLTGGHQLKNAAQLKKMEAAEVVDNDAKPDKLLETIVELLNDPKKRQKLAKNLSATAKPDASADLAKVLLQIIRPNKKNETKNQLAP